MIVLRPAAMVWADGRLESWNGVSHAPEEGSFGEVIEGGHVWQSVECNDEPKAGGLY